MVGQWTPNVSDEETAIITITTAIYNQRNTYQKSLAKTWINFVFVNF